MDYFAYSENINGRSDVSYGSMNVEYEPLAIRLHAVARDDDGTMRSRTECGRPARFPPEEVEHVPWENINQNKRCLECGKATGFLAVNGDTGEVVPGLR